MSSQPGANIAARHPCATSLYIAVALSRVYVGYYKSICQSWANEWCFKMRRSRTFSDCCSWNVKRGMAKRVNETRLHVLCHCFLYAAHLVFVARSKSPSRKENMCICWQAAPSIYKFLWLIRIQLVSSFICELEF